MKSFNALVAQVEACKADAAKVAKVAKGEKAAGTRLRAGMQEVKKLAGDVRAEVLERR